MSKNKANFSLQNGLIGEANSQRNQKKKHKTRQSKETNKSNSKRPETLHSPA